MKVLMQVISITAGQLFWARNGFWFYCGYRRKLQDVYKRQEQNYNMIDNVLNNGVGEKAQREENKRMEEKPTVRLSLKSRLAEKKSQVEGQSKEHDVQENEKKSQREM